MESKRSLTPQQRDQSEPPSICALRPSHCAWLEAECSRLLAFGSHVGVPGLGAAYLDDRGHPVARMGVHTWITARMAHTYSLGVLLGRPGARAVAETVLSGLTGQLRDTRDGGWFCALDSDGTPDPLAGKSCYDHAFVLLAASSGVNIGWEHASALLEGAADVFLNRFWDEDTGLVIDAWESDFSRPLPYRGLNSAMHTVEAMLAAADVSDAGDAAAWRQRALRTAGFVASLTRRHLARLPEHFDQDWVPIANYNKDRPADRFRPFGVTPGHGLEWARLLLQVEAATGEASGDLVEAAVLLFDRAVSDGWHVDGHDGFVYTTDWDGVPVVRHRMRWVLAEAIAAAAALYRRLGDERYGAWYLTWWDYAERSFIDRSRGSWHHELDPRNRPTSTMVAGKPDLYHAVQATLLPRLPLFPSLARGLRDGLLESDQPLRVADPSPPDTAEGRFHSRTP